MPYKFIIAAGNHDRDCCPVMLPLPDGCGISGDVILSDGNGTKIRAQYSRSHEAGAALTFVLNGLPAGSEREYAVTGNNSENGVSLIEKKDSIDVLIEGKYFTSYVYGGGYAKPFVGPVVGSNGESYTRLDFKTPEHPHHRSVWIAVGDVNGVDFWNEPEGCYGRQIHQRFDGLISGPVYARISASNTWTDFSGTRL